MAAYSASIGKSGAYSFDAGAIADLSSLVKKYIGSSPTVTIKLDEAHEIETDDLDKLFSDPYVKNRNIIGIKIRGSNYREEGSRIDIDIDDQGFGGVQIRINVAGDRDRATTIRQEIEVQIDGRKLWYSKCVLPNSPIPLIGFYGLLIVGAVAILVVIEAFLLPGLEENARGVIVLVGTPIIFGVILSVKRKMFPKVLFAIGRSAEKIASARMWRQVVFGVLILGFLVNVVAAVLVR